MPEGAQILTGGVDSSLFAEFSEVGRQLMALGMNSSHSGNLSVRRGETIFIKRSGAMLGCLKTGDVIAVPMNEAKPGGVSIEYPVHRVIYFGTSAEAVIHCHPPHAIALSLGREFIEPVDLEGRHVVGSVKVVPQGADAACAIVEAIGGGEKAVVVKGHGIFAAGRTLFEVLHIASSLEMSAKIICIASRT